MKASKNFGIGAPTKGAKNNKKQRRKNKTNIPKVIREAALRAAWLIGQRNLEKALWRRALKAPKRKTERSGWEAKHLGEQMEGSKRSEVGEHLGEKLSARTDTRNHGLLKDIVSGGWPFPMKTQQKREPLWGVP